MGVPPQIPVPTTRVVVLGAIPDDPGMIYFSRVDDPLEWDVLLPELPPDEPIIVENKK